MATFRTGQKTHQAVLPQRPALESESVDTPRIGHETGLRPHPRVVPGAEHVRGETGTAAPGGSGVTPQLQAGERPRERHPSVFVLDKNQIPLQPCHPARARKLLHKGRAVVARHTPFTIRLKDRTIAESEVDGVQVGIDPGSKHTGIAVFTHQGGQRRGRYSIQLDHRGAQVRKKMGQRSAYRRRRRTANLRHRAPRFANRTRPQGWLAPSLRHRVETTTAWVDRLTRWAPVKAVHMERVAFDTHALDALAVGKVDTITQTTDRVLIAGCAGRGSYARTRPDKHGFPRLGLPRTKGFFGFTTGDLVRAVVPQGKKAGTHTGRVAVRASGSFNITTTHGTIQGIGHKYMRLLQRADGYGYTWKGEGVSSRPSRTG